MRLRMALTVVWLIAGLAAIEALAQATKPTAGPIVVLETVKGTIEFETYPEDAPKTVARILELVKKNFYNGQRFHRSEPKFIVQIGDPTSRDMTKEAYWGRSPRSGTGEAIGVAEISKKRRHGVGTVGMAHAGDPKYSDSQFYITRRVAPELDGKYTIFGRVINGMDVVHKLARADRLMKAYVKP